MMYAMQKNNAESEKAFKYFESQRFVDEVMFDLETDNQSNGLPSLLEHSRSDLQICSLVQLRQYKSVLLINQLTS